MADIPVDITLTEDKSEQLHKICREVVLEHDMGYLEQDNGRANIERCLQVLVAAAVHTGFLHGCEPIEAVHARESHKVQSAVEKELEQKRVWGYDVGWKLRSELLQMASTTPSSTPPHALSVAVMQMEPAVVFDVPVVPDVPLDWAEDAAVFPISSCPPSLSTSPSLRDFSVPTQLDWDRDLSLRDLSRALTALGWVKV
ncbi:hypothetical protein B0H14DRAFT_2632399 [Mycena olivaceomarginata]|nr:hypothetical protein B0H14DRAFT_2632399 [Mycena olivaceomarginata]